MPASTKLNLREVDDSAPGFGMPDGMEARFAHEALGLEQSGVTYFRYPPNVRIPFGHRHRDQEEVYVVVSGSARAKVGDELVELGPFDALRVAPDTPRAFEAGPEGAEIIAYGAPSPASKEERREEAEMLPGFWPAE